MYGFQNISADEFAELKEKEGYVVLDVRSPMELAEGSVEGHTMINMFDPSFVERINQLDKEKSYLVYCRGGNRSSQACMAMSQMGFKNLYNLNGGIGAWNTYMAYATQD